MDTKLLFDPLSLPRGPALKNRLALAALTNQQSHDDGRLSTEEIRWLTMRASGGFALTLTAAGYVQRNGRGFAGQLGFSDDAQLEGLSELAAAIRANGSVSGAQLYHAGSRAMAEDGQTMVSASDDPNTGARGLTLAEVETVRDDFIAAARRGELAGFDGVEVHGAHGYLLNQFLSAEMNRRTDRYGGSVENRARLIFEIIDGIRSACHPDFQIGLRISTERYGLSLAETRDFAAELFLQAKIDYLDLSLWDVNKEPEEEAYKGRSLMSYFTELPRGQVRLAAAGKVMSAATARSVIENGCDFVMIGRAAILHHDFPDRVRQDENYASPPTPVSVAHLEAEGVSTAFRNYLGMFPGFIEKEPT
jgi:2,4-dienoyl-CoA reductase-like NADH-dependent reductase (Old Yellow Enzyme family)